MSNCCCGSIRKMKKSNVFPQLLLWTGRYINPKFNENYRPGDATRCMQKYFARRLEMEDCFGYSYSLGALVVNRKKLSRPVHQQQLLQKSLADSIAPGGRPVDTADETSGPEEQRKHDGDAWKGNRKNIAIYIPGNKLQNIHTMKKMIHRRGITSRATDSPESQ